MSDKGFNVLHYISFISRLIKVLHDGETCNRFASAELQRLDGLSEVIPLENVHQLSDPTSSREPWLCRGAKGNRQNLLKMTPGKDTASLITAKTRQGRSKNWPLPPHGEWGGHLPSSMLAQQCSSPFRFWILKRDQSVLKADRRISKWFQHKGYLYYGFYCNA